MIIGLSGKYCAGKNAAAAVFEELGIPSIDVDKLGHMALEHRVSEIEAEFGSCVIAEDGSVDRKKLGAVVFSDPARLKALEGISHPWMVEEVSRIIEEHRRAGAESVVVNAAILEHMGLHRLCDVVVWVDAPLPVRIRRALARDPLALPAVIKRIYAQRALRSQPLKKYVDIYRVGNSSGFEALKKRIIGFLDLYGTKGK